MLRTHKVSCPVSGLVFLSVGDHRYIKFLSVFLKQGNDVVPLNFSYPSCMITKALYIFSIYTAMKKVRIMEANEITVRNIQAYMERTVTRFGSGAKVDCPKEFLGKKAYLIIERDEE